MDSVKVALRIRPFVSTEIDSGCRPCIERTPGENQIAVGKRRQFYTFNYVFDEFEGQELVYSTAVRNLLDNLFKGYNVTILAYGQTGSGKTYTMGTNYDGLGELGVIPRAIVDIFEIIKNSPDKEVKVSVSFLELYNESLYDLLTRKSREESIVDLRESQQGISIPGLTTAPVNSMQETLSYLKEGSSGRVTGATAMNATSSRSHAIFTINIRIINRDNPKDAVSSKFHLVDLAGSERSKKTGTTGDRFKEGVNINRGLLNLGNVISQLGEGCQYVNYRDSKLTRLLQDSLGGNSVTLMIACISPADYNQDETLSTLRYADRVKKIKNKPVVNQDPQIMEITRLKKEVEDLRLQIINTGSSCPPEHADLEEKLMQSMKKISQLSEALDDALKQSTGLFEIRLLADSWKEKLSEKLNELGTLSESSMLLPESERTSSFVALNNKIMEVKEDYNKAQKEIFTHEKQVNVDTPPLRDFDNITTDRALVTENILTQAKLNKEIQEISNTLLWKEELINKLSEDSCGMTGLQEVSLKEFMALKEQLATLQEERESLIHQIEVASGGNTPAAKLAAQRRKQLQDLEHKYASLQKKMQEQERIIKMKEKSEEKIANLKKEIQMMKQVKVKLIRDLRNECNKNKALNDEKNREVIKLRSLNAKTKNQLLQMEQQHFIQQNVLKRKLESAAAANKRIMDALARQRMGEKKIKTSVSERISEIINEELEIVESAFQAEKSLQSLIQYRATLHKQVEDIKKNLKSSKLTSEEHKQLDEQLKRHQSDMDLRSIQISDLQQQILDAQQADRGKNRWDQLQTMGEAKFALSHIFDTIADLKRDIITRESLYNDLKECNEDLLRKHENCEAKLEDLNSIHNREINNLEREYEEKISLLLRTYSTFGNSDKCSGHVECINIQNEELQKLNALREENKFLKDSLQQLQRRSQVGSYEDAFSAFLYQTTSIDDIDPEDGTNKENAVLPSDVEDIERLSEPSEITKSRNSNILQDSHNQENITGRAKTNENIEQQKETSNDAEESSTQRKREGSKNVRAYEIDEWDNSFMIKRKRTFFED